MDMKPVVLWEVKRSEKRKATGEVVPGDFVGKFRTKVQAGTQGAIHIKGTNQAGKAWDFHALEVDSVNGVVRWVDVRESDFGQQILLFMESAKALHQISIPFDVRNLRGVMNHICGLGKELEVAHINVSYWVRKQTDAKGVAKTDKDGNAFWAKDLTFRDVPQKFTFEQWKDFAQQNGLEWFQEVRNGKKEWNFTAEVNYWLAKMVDVQRWLLTKPLTLPFTWNSAVFGPPNFSETEIETAKAMYEAAKNRYRFPYSRSQVDADSVLDAKVEERPFEENPFSTSDKSEFPANDLTDYENGMPELLPKGASGIDTDDLPF